MVITTRRVSSLAELLQSSHLICATIGPKSELIVLSSDRPYWNATTHTFAQGPLTYRLFSFHSEEWHEELAFGPTDAFYTFVQPLPDSRWLFVGSRSGGPGNRNAHVLDRNGNHLYSFNAGDGIEHIQATTAGDVWVGYFDEGIFGEGELSHSGLVCLSDTGTPLVRFWEDIAEPNHLPGIDDCYALNVADKEVWVSYYSAFPLVKLDDKRLSHAWTDWPHKPAKSLAVADDKLLIVPAYKKEGPLHLVDTTQSTVVDVEITDPEGHPMHLGASCGRGSILCFISAGPDASVHSVDIGALDFLED